MVAVVALCVFLTLWYAVGYLYNRRLGQRLFHWLDAGLDVLGSERQVGWIGSPASGARFHILHAKPPFRRAEVTLLLARREIPLLWLLDYLQGRRDGLIIKTTLRSAEQGELEVSPARSGVLGLSKRPSILPQEPSWTLDQGPHGLVIARHGTYAQQQLTRLKPWLEAYGASLRHFSWQKRDPHIQFQMNVGGLTATSSETFLADLQAAVGKPTHVNK
jgi:hypothetical protein